ncbi:hypothetical protein ACFL5M_05440 [Candidatus Neomarinimicrobiota bacterium]
MNLQIFISLTIIYLFTGWDILSAQQDDISFYIYKYAGYPEVQAPGNIDEVDRRLKAGIKLKYDQLKKIQQAQNYIYYDYSIKEKELSNLAMECNWNEIKKISIVLDIDYSFDTLSILWPTGVLNKPEGYSETKDSVFTHFIHNRLKRYIKARVAYKWQDLDDRARQAKELEIFRDILSEKINVHLNVLFKDSSEPTQYYLRPRQSGLNRQYSRWIDLSLTSVDTSLVGNILLSVPFRYRSKVPPDRLFDFRMLGDITTFGPSFIIMPGVEEPIGFGGFVGIGLSERGHMILGVAGGYLFSSKEWYTGLSYNMIGLVEGLIDLSQGRSALRGG